MQGPSVLTINSGSSSIRFALFAMAESPIRRLHGKMDRVGQHDTNLTFNDLASGEYESHAIGELEHGLAADVLLDWLDKRIGLTSLRAVGHRVVNGGARYKEPQHVTSELTDELRRISTYAPEHLPSEIALIELFRNRAPDLVQVACFDTAFHHSMPRVAKILPIPRRYEALGVERYGFHGLSYAFLIEELARVAGEEAASGRVILAHLGNGASLSAVRDGKSIDTTMGFTPAAGVPMGTRSGDLDPGLVLFCARTEGMTADQFHHMVNHEAGLLGVSETSSDLRDLLKHEARDVRASEAVDLFCYGIKKSVGALAAALGGLDTLVFTGGIGENSRVVRARICAGLDFLGIHLDAVRNENNGAIISTDAGHVSVRVIATDEEMIIAKAVGRVLEHASHKELGT
ncbi:acetate/propionate family kinase [Rhizobium giardinii]|uniref:acetate/propionate family kinase n=1 Tax=Rhizobium giardinii TaxID=56731 RepID=UPI003D6F3C16